MKWTIGVEPGGGNAKWPRVVVSSPLHFDRWCVDVFRRVFKSAFVVAVLAISDPSVAADAEIDRELFSRGMDIYNENCAVCHGENGDGKGPLATGFTPRPRDLTKGVFKFRTSEVGEFAVQADLISTIRRGISGSVGQLMPPFEHLGEDDLIALTEVIRVAAGAPSFGSPIVVPPRPEAANLARGEALYRELGCVDCHGENGDGGGPLAAGLVDSDGLGIRPADLRLGQFKGGNDPSAIWMRIYNGIDGTPMPSFSRNASGAELWAIVEYVLMFSNRGSQ